MRTGIPLLASIVSLACAGIASAAGEGWTTDFEAARKEAATSGKSLLLDFTGSDWCGWCIRLQDEVFKHDTFKQGVKDKFVLVELDFPQDTSKQSPALIEQNKMLGEKYAVEGYPTILLVDSDGRPYAATGYKAGGPGEYVNHLNTLLERKKVRDDAFTKAGTLEGSPKAAALIGALDAMELGDALVTKFYAGTVEEIKKSDPEDSTGYAKRLAVKERMAKFQGQLNELASKQDYGAALILIGNTLNEGGLSPEDTQQVTLMKALIFAEQKKFDEAIAVVEETRKIAPDSELSSRLDGLKRQLESMKGQ